MNAPFFSFFFDSQLFFFFNPLGIMPRASFYIYLRKSKTNVRKFYKLIEINFDIYIDPGIKVEHDTQQ